MPRSPTIQSGDRFGLLVAKDRVRGKNGLLLWRFECDCGNEKINNGQPMLRAYGAWRSCGCQKQKYGKEHHNYTHGKRHDPIYRTWDGMRQRCHNPKQINYPRYGGLGVKVCDKWFQSFEAFYADMGDKPSAKHTIDRINPFGDYEPENCRWATRSEQARNTRKAYAQLELN